MKYQVHTLEETVTLNRVHESKIKATILHIKYKSIPD